MYSCRDCSRERFRGNAADDTLLRHVNGNVSYRVSQTAQPVAVTSTQVIADEAFAITGRASQGVLTLPDSSLVGLGANTNIQVAAFKRADTGDGTTITIPATGGTIRFQINRPQGGKSNYTFVTPVASISVRGTVGLLTHGPNGDTIACLVCTPGDVSVAVGTQTYGLLTGQTLVVTLAGVVTAGVITAAILQGLLRRGSLNFSGGDGTCCRRSICRGGRRHRSRRRGSRCSRSSGAH